ncbi:large ribosomal subunit protein mL66 [Palaemon carinicauda]|uniref:large ribosomal subunit protein mL66 n=1 Tax=Palaemon carinicauda TaxID=392227 RepID=UPI0035B6A609
MAFRTLACAGKNTFGSVLHAVLPVKQSVCTSMLPCLGLSAAKHFSLSSQNNVKKIIVDESEKVTTISAEYVESPLAPRLLKKGKEGSHDCPLCALNLNVKHTDVLILSQFLRPDGCLLPRRTTGLCTKQQLRIKYLVTMSQKAGLMPNLAPSWSKKDPRKRYGSKKFNRYFDEATLD